MMEGSGPSTNLIRIREAQKRMDPGPERGFAESPIQIPMSGAS